MENRVRDLEQLQEQDSDRRKRGSLAMAALAILALAFAIGLVVGKAALPATPERDPLDQLDRVAEAARREAAAAAPPSAAKAGAGEPEKAPVAKPGASQRVETSQLTFERSLTEVEERPEVLAALEAAGREEERIAIHTAAPRGGRRIATTTTSAGSRRTKRLRRSAMRSRGLCRQVWPRTVRVRSSRSRSRTTSWSRRRWAVRTGVPLRAAVMASSRCRSSATIRRRRLKRLRVRCVRAVTRRS
jgi:hypothetical protein